MNKKWFMIILVILTIINLSILGTFIFKRVYHKRGFFPLGREEHFIHMKKQFHLTDEQVSRMKSSREKYESKIEALSQELKEKRHTLVKELMKESPDSTRVEDMLSLIDSSQSVLQREVVEHLLADKEILTPEQQEKFFTVILGHFLDGNKTKH
ncbi:MAG: periplasmic heavy metal sensor [bacterium]|nr:periplasmic heavy metal sensor [bacterium]